jgi:thiamine pyrophosphate-dependent acetolactate synthase large subunit-like protein
MVRSREQNAGKNYNTKIDNKSFESVEEFKYKGATLTNQNSIQEEIKSRLNAGILSIIRCRISCLPVCYPKI